MNMYQVREDLIINLDSVDVVHYIEPKRDKHIIRLYIRGVKHEYHLTSDQWTKLEMKIKEKKK